LSCGAKFLHSRIKITKPPPSYPQILGGEWMVESSCVNPFEVCVPLYHLNLSGTIMIDERTASVQMAGIQLAMEQGKRLYRPKEYVDFYPSLVRMMEQRLHVNNNRDRPNLQPSRDYTRRVLPTSTYHHCPAACMPTRFFHTLQNKKKNGINSVVWTRDGRRLTTGSKNGDFTFWDAISMKYDTQIIPPDGKPIRSMAWSHSGKFMLSGCHGGIVQWWDQGLTPVKKITAHESADGQHTVRDISWAPFDTKFGTCSDDKTIKVWTVMGKCELKMTGHRWDVKALDWHPTKPLLVSGSKDNTVKLWDARSGMCLVQMPLCVLVWFFVCAVCGGWFV
jgi:polyadenylation factor subunit 2